MKLTKKMREDFVNLVMSKVRIRNNYNVDKLREDTTSIAVSLLPVELQKVYKKYPDYMRLKSKYVYCADLPNYYINYFGDQDPNSFDITHLLAKLRKAKAETDRRLEMRKRLTDVANSVTTTQKLKDALPELAHLVPEAEAVAVKYLPTTTSGIINDLKELGFEVTQ